MKKFIYLFISEKIYLVFNENFLKIFKISLSLSFKQVW